MVAEVQQTATTAATIKPPVEVILEQYKLYVEMADRVSARRVEASKFYLSLLSALLAVISLASIPARLTPIIFATAAALGIILCLVWGINLESYRALNSLKFKVIHELEQQLPFQCYQREWEVLRLDPKRTYVRLSRVEQFVPLVLMVPYIVLLIMATKL
jgi:hypothetical protein